MVLLEETLEPDPAAHRWTQDQRWTLARIAEVTWDLLDAAHQELGAPIMSSFGTTGHLPLGPDAPVL